LRLSHSNHRIHPARCLMTGARWESTQLTWALPLLRHLERSKTGSQTTYADGKLVRRTAELKIRRARQKVCAHNVRIRKHTGPLPAVTRRRGERYRFFGAKKLAAASFFE